MDLRVTADILENETGDLLLAFHEVEGEPEAPVLGIKGEEAVLHRRSNQNVVIGKIHPDIFKKLSSALQVLVTEVNSSGIVNGYFAKVATVH